MSKIFNLVIRYALYGLVFLMPLFWLPWSGETYEFNKQYLLVCLAAVGLMAWLAKMIMARKRILFRRTPLDLFIVAFMAVLIISAVFSLDKVSSWLGFYGRFSDAVVGGLALLVLYFLVVNNIKSRQIPTILKVFLGSSCLVVLTAYSSLFNLWSKIPAFFNPTSSSYQGLAVFLVMLITLATGLLLKSKGKIQNLLAGFLYVASAILLVLINFQPAWLILGLTMLVMLALLIWTRFSRQQINLLLLPVILLILSVFCSFSDLPEQFVQDKLGVEDLPQEVILDQETAQAVTWQAVKERPLLGSGPGTFLINFSQFKPAEFNYDRFWNVRFDKGPSQLLEMVSTVGALGIAAYLLPVFIFLLIGFFFFKSRNYPISELSEYPIPLFSAWLALLIGQFVYLQNTVLAFYFWLLMALTILVWQRVRQRPLKKISFSFKELPEVGLIMSIVLMIALFGLTTLFYLGGRFYWAEANYRRGETIEQLEQTVNLNGYREVYCRSLSRAYLIAAWQEVDKPEAERTLKKIQSYSQGAITQARLASQISPELVMPWDNLGVIYRDSRGLIGGTLPFAAEAFQAAIDLEPTNPLYYRQICRINLINQEESKSWEETISYCQRAIELKDNYLDAHFQLALVYEGQGYLEKALAQMQGALEKLKGISFERGSKLAEAATEVYFQLGRLHFNLNQNEQAIKMFEQSVIITPNYANAHFGLAMAYKQANRLDDSLTQLIVVNQLVPGNQVVEESIQALRQLISAQD